MALTTVEKVIQGICDRLAFIQGVSVSVFNGGTDFWDRVDGAGDETFENRVKGSNATALDAALLALPLGELSSLRSFLSDINNYAKTDLGYSDLDAYLTAKGWRIDQRTASFLRTAGIVISVANIHASADAGLSAPGLDLGNYLQGTGYVDGAAINTAVASPSALLARVTVLGAADWTLTVTADLGATTKSIAQVVSGTGAGGAVGDVYVIGKQALNAGAAAGQKVVPVAATAQFEAGQTVLITQFSGVAPDEVWAQQEKGVIASVQTNTSITLVDNLKHTYTSSGFAYPCFVGASNCTATGGTAGNRVYFYPAADRRLKL